MIDRIKNLLDKEADSVKNIPISNPFDLAINLIYKQVHQNKGKLVASGVGKAGQIAINIATCLSSTGTPAVFLNATEAQHGDLGILQPNDILLLISNSGKTNEIVDLVTLTKRLYQDIPLIVITGNTESALAQKADVCLHTGSPKEICPLGLTPTTSTTTMTVIGDILVVLLMEKIKFTSEEYALRHHGGYLGVKSRIAAEKEKNE